jgi:cellulose 1,4-beta-cellobiosidase
VHVARAQAVAIVASSPPELSGPSVALADLAGANAGGEVPMSRWSTRRALICSLSLAAACSAFGSGEVGDQKSCGGDDEEGGGQDAGDGAVITIPTGENPFTDAVGYINPDYVAQVESSMAAHPAEAETLRKVADVSTAVWLDSIAKVARLDGYLDDALAQQEALGRPVVPLFVVYDLPNRDCAALASNGELSVAADGVARYRAEYIDAIAAAFRAHPGQRIAAIIEPDSLGNIATNLSVPHCAESEAAYRESVAYAIEQLSMPHTFLYVDAAHAGWLGWPDNTSKIATIFDEVLTAAGGADKVRGFATNVANYTVLDETAERFDYQGNPCHDEATYVEHLAAALAAVGITDKGFLIDTSRNGRGGIRSEWGAWCNVGGAGIGERPAVSPRPGLDAYVWVKPPGESDGTSDSTAPRFDAHCAGPDATLGAPQAGQWFDAYFVQLAANATPPL